MNPMNTLKNEVDNSGLFKTYIAKRVGLSSSHFSQMLSGKVTMPEHIRNKVTDMLNQVKKISV